MSIRVDLHSHSTASDGTLTPTELFTRAAERGVDALALTDHDTLSGLSEAGRAASGCGVLLIPGVEISVTWNKRTIHIVGLNVDSENAQLRSGLEQLREFRVWRTQEIARRLEKAGVAGAYDGALSFAHGDLVSRTHFARFLVSTGRAESVPDVFRRYLVHGKPGHVSGQWAELATAVGWINAAGGQAVLAHPARYKLTRSRMIRLLTEFQAAGGCGIEVISGSHSKDECYKMAKFAEDFGFKSSVGSDFHSPDNRWIDLGRLPELPSTCQPIWADWPHLHHGG